MLPAANRLKSTADFGKIFKYGKVSENEFLRIKFIKNQKGCSRFGFIVSNKFAKKAAERNLIKRRLRAAVGFLLKNVKPGFDVAVWPKAALKKSEYRMLVDNLKNILIKNDILFVQ
ncbi:ribonuclease P protein component [Candidatus Azambacteria bacterium]|nr:ribonuclease P protein component [Candidatus Azambacteria bacterium]